MILGEKFIFASKKMALQTMLPYNLTLSTWIHISNRHMNPNVPASQFLSSDDAFTVLSLLWSTIESPDQENPQGNGRYHFVKVFRSVVGVRVNGTSCHRIHVIMDDFDIVTAYPS
jgi:hypothetical protein